MFFLIKSLVEMESEVKAHRKLHPGDTTFGDFVRAVAYVALTALVIWAELILYSRPDPIVYLHILPTPVIMPQVTAPIPTVSPSTVLAAA